jgi:TRAP-type C4-dicarboxylate transport system permease small subunit
VVLTLMMMLKLGSNSRMTMIDLPMNWVYGICMFGFAAMAVRAVQVALIHRRRGYCVLERPESEMSDR